MPHPIARRPERTATFTVHPQLAPGFTEGPRQTVPAVIETVVPAALIAPLKQALGVDVSDVRVRRGEEVTDTARRLGARGFTADEVVHVPDSAGPLDGREAAPVLAHELTHAAQQRQFGAALPGLETVAGRRLEADAVAVEQWVADGANGTAPPVRGHEGPMQLAREDNRDEDNRDEDSPAEDSPSEEDEEEEPAKGKRKSKPDDGTYGPLDWGNVSKPAREEQVGGFRRLTGLRLPTLWGRPRKPPSEGVLDEFRRRTGAELALPDSWNELPATTPETLIAEQLKRAGKDKLELPSSWGTTPDDSPAGILVMADHLRRQQERAEAESEKDSGPPGSGLPPGSRKPLGRPSAPELAGIVGELADNPPRRWLDLDDPDHFEEIANRIYNTLHTRLRFEMLVDRERSGTLMDFG
ncbi:DUF4157 domain-containing protein [Amycolatopsis sp. NPDC051071]|uniref:eCIS core domain-containing protein n=1 Tax=Amycolatopsis sp. NPDC051071 TaxID=3154637 RepID=UPI00344755F4